MEFRWNAWNIDHAAKHGVSRAGAEHVADRAARPFPEFIGDGKWLVRGQTAAGDYLQVIYLVDPDGTAYVIHARFLTDAEKRRLRRRLRR